MGCGICTENQDIKNVSDLMHNANTYSKSVSALSINPNPTRFTENYKVGKPLSSTSLGEIREAIHRASSHQRTVKILLKDECELINYEKFLTEIKILQKLDHQNIIRYFECFEDEKRVYSILEKVEGGELFDELFMKKSVSERNAASIIKQLLSCVSYLHDQGIVHRDLRPENIMLEQGESFVLVKVVDFGSATAFGPSIRLDEMIGSAFYLAPEMAKSNYSELVDEWSLGVILFILLSGCPPFPGNTNDEIMIRARSCKYLLTDPIWDKISDSAKDLLDKLLCPAKSRIPAKEALNHSWIQSFGLYATPDEDFTHQVLSNLHQFTHINRFKDAVSLFITSQISTNQEARDLKALFTRLDLDNDGKLTAEEMKTGLKGLTEIINPDEYIDRIMKEVDTDGNGVIDYNEFLRATLDENELYCKANLRRAFEIFDSDKSGKISSSELQRIFILGEANADMWDEVVGQADLNADGEIDFREFCNFMLELSNK